MSVKLSKYVRIILVQLNRGTWKLFLKFLGMQTEFSTKNWFIKSVFIQVKLSLICISSCLAKLSTNVNMSLFHWNQNVLFSISSFIQVSNNEARKCEWKYTKYIIIYFCIYKNVLHILCIQTDITWSSWQDCQHRPRNAPSVGGRQGPGPLSMMVYRLFILRLN